MKHRRTAALTGGIHTGKSTASRMFRELGAYVIDADDLARQVVAPGLPAWVEIVSHFGKGILCHDGQLDRAKLARIVFGDPKARLELNRMTHPRIIDEIRRREEGIRSLDDDVVIIVDAPLLIEASLHKEYSTIIVVAAPESVQIHRILAKGGLSLVEARQRVDAQLPLADKLALADHVIDGAGEVARTMEQVTEIFRSLKAH